MEEIKKGQLQLTQLLKSVVAGLRIPGQETGEVPPPPGNGAFPRGMAQTFNRQARQQSAQVVQPSWASITESAAGNGWTTVTNYKKRGTEGAKCFLCAGEHQGSKHECTAESCTRDQDHASTTWRSVRIVKTTLGNMRRCPKGKSSRQARQQKVTEMRSSPPVMEIATEQDDPPI
jgi:hypothetical protein